MQYTIQQKHACEDLMGKYHIKGIDAVSAVVELDRRPKYISVQLHNKFILYTVGLSPAEATFFLRDHGYEN